MAACATSTGSATLDAVAFFYRGADPTPIPDTTLGGINIPIRIGGATVLPGDVVLGTPTGVTFIPPHLVEEIVEVGEDVHRRDVVRQATAGGGPLHARARSTCRLAEDIEADYQAWLGG